MKKQKENKTTREPKTIKVSTLALGVTVLAAMVLSFVAGTVYANNYNDTVRAEAVELHKEFKKEQLKSKSEQ